MIALNTLLRALTGPRRLRSALRRKTVAIGSLLVALDGPGELRATIPAAVFGGDIFGVMSSQLRDALIVAQLAPVSLSKPEVRRLGASSVHPSSQDFKNPFSLNLDHPTLPTQRGSSAPELTSRASLIQNEMSPEQGLVRPFSPLETGISPKGIGASLFGETTMMSVKPSVNPAASSAANSLPLTPALVSSLNRYWQAVREGRDTSRLKAQTLNESPANTASVPVADAEEHTAPRAWPTSVGRDVSQKLRSFADVDLPMKSRVSSAPDRGIQNVFNIEVNHANHHSSSFDDLGDRIAQILHEQALQHGIDVT